MRPQGGIGPPEMPGQPGICIFQTDEPLPANEPPYGVHGNKGQAQIHSEDLK